MIQVEDFRERAYPWGSLDIENQVQQGQLSLRAKLLVSILYLNEKMFQKRYKRIRL